MYIYIYTYALYYMTICITLRSDNCTWWQVAQHSPLCHCRSSDYKPFGSIRRS